MHRFRVLLADDHPDVADELRLILEPEFDVVAVCGDGSALLAGASTLDPDVIVSDIAMPVMDGLQATTEILRRAPNARVVLVTIHGEPGVQRRAFDTGALGFVTKFRADADLLPAVRAALRGERFVGWRAERAP